MIKLSVIIPAYNVANYIEACLHSIIKEQYPNKEIIVINDGSTDNTSEILAKMKEKHPSLILVNQKNQGLSAARNKGIDLVTGDYLTFVDSDDIISETMYTEMIATLPEVKADIVTTGVARLGKTVYPSVLHEHFMQEDHRGTTIYETTNLLYDTTSWNKIYRTSFFRELQLKFPIGKTFEDIYVVILAYLYAKQINVIKKAHYFWRWRVGHTKSITQQKNSLKQINDRLEALYAIDHIFADLNITGKLLAQKEYKFLEIDLFSMIEWLFLAPKEVFNSVREKVTYYLQNNLQTNQFRNLPKQKQKMFLTLQKNQFRRFKWYSYLYFFKKVFNKWMIKK